MSIESFDDYMTTDCEELADLNVSYEISNYPADLSLAEYYRKWKKEEKDLEIPEFQRNYVWNKNEASRLIESFLLGLPVPGVFLYKKRRDNKLLIIDGQQRILSVIRFLDGFFGDKVFRLSNVRERWNNKSFNELCDNDKRLLEDSILRATIIQQLNPDDESSIFHIFERLNTGGKNLNPMEVRRCVYNGNLLHTIEALNEYKSWRSLIGKNEVDQRYVDVEWILRSFALGTSLETYEKPMKVFLNKFCINNREVFSDKLKLAIDQFTDLTDYLLNELGERPFNLKGKINYAVIDSVIGTLVSVDKNQWPSDIKDRYEILKMDENFIKCISANTSDANAVQNRFERVKTILLG